MLQKTLLAFSFLLMGFVGQALAVNGTIDMTNVAFPISDAEAVASLMIAALASLWVIRRVISLVRSR